MSDTRREQALAMAASGYSVIPLYPGSKRAMVPWAEFQRRRATVSEIQTWWTDEPDANIGIVTGEVSGVVVADVDPRNGGSTDEVLARAPTYMIVSTPGGGHHLYYRCPAPGVKKGRPAPGVDFQAEGSYVVAWGSHVVTDHYEGEYTLVKNSYPADPPDWLLQSLPDQTTQVPDDSPANWIASVLIRGCPAGTRNATLARLAGYLAAQGVPADISDALLWRWVREQDGTHVSREECSTTVRSVYATAAARSAQPSTRRYVVDKYKEGIETALEAVPLSSFLPKFYRDDVDWLVPEWLPSRTVAFLVAPPGRFKTMLTFDLAISVASGWPFLGQVAVQNPGPVLVIQQEDDYGDMARRFHRIFTARQPGRPVPEVDEETVADHLGVSPYPPVYICTTRGFNLEYENLRRLEDLIFTLRPRLIIIDPLYSITSADEFMMQAAKGMLPLKDLRDEYGVSFVIAAHTKKGAGGDREGLWGSQFLNAFLETGWQIRDVPDGESNQITLRRHFKNSGEPEMVKLEFLLGADSDYSVVISDPEDEFDAVFQYLQQRAPDLVPTNVLVRISGLSERNLDRRLHKLLEKKQVQRTDIGPSGAAWSYLKDPLAEVTG